MPSLVSPACVLLLLASIALAHPTTVFAQSIAPTAGPLYHCQYDAVDPPPARGSVAFPDGDLYRPLLADPREPRISFTYLRAGLLEGATPAEARAQTVNAGAVSVGGIVGLWARHSASSCRGVQVSLVGGVFSQFNLDTPSRDLINSDFVIGTQIVARTRGISGRIRLYHQSSHLGEDSTLRDPSIGILNFGFQAIDGLVSLDGAWWRMYGGGGYLSFMNDGPHSGLLQGGAELRSPRRAAGALRPVAGVDVTSLQARSWGVTTAALAGVEWTSPAATRRLRASFVFVSGFTPFGHFVVQQKSRTTGVQFQIEF
jgi:hypothetical protein